MKGAGAVLNLSMTLDPRYVVVAGAKAKRGENAQAAGSPGAACNPSSLRKRVERKCMYAKKAFFMFASLLPYVHL
jgi:hypothetical protein